MNTILNKALNRLNAVTRSWDPNGDHSFADYARMLVVTVEVKRLTAEEALQMPSGLDREQLVELHDLAVGMERKARTRLNAPVGHFGPTGAA